MSHIESVQMGQWYLVNGRLDRSSASGDVKYWIHDGTIAKPAMYIGQRTLSNGKNFWIGEFGNAYEATEYFKALMFVHNERSKPFHVLEKDVKGFTEFPFQVIPLRRRYDGRPSDHVYADMDDNSWVIRCSYCERETVNNNIEKYKPKDLIFNNRLQKGRAVYSKSYHLKPEVIGEALELTCCCGVEFFTRITNNPNCLTWCHRAWREEEIEKSKYFWKWMGRQ